MLRRVIDALNDYIFILLILSLIIVFLFKTNKNRIKAFNPWPLANILIDDKEIKIIEAEFKKEKVNKANCIIINKNKLGISCLDGIIYLKKIKPFGKKEMNIESYLNGINKEEYIKKAVS